MVVYVLATLNGSVKALTNSGPQQDEYVQNLKDGMNSSVMPRLRSAFAETITEVQPEIKQSFSKLGKRLPEVTSVAKNQLQALETDLPTKGEAVLNQSFRTIITGKQSAIHQMYPDLTDDQLKTLVSNLANEGEIQARAANQDLFAPHQAKLNDILSNIEKIKTQEAANVKHIEPSWDMAILLLDILREDIKSQEPVNNPTIAKVASTKEVKA
ncbi:MAG TPA: hypothetical protein VGL56_17450 [Fimbriimonadaceae bacterium]